MLAWLKSSGNSWLSASKRCRPSSNKTRIWVVNSWRLSCTLGPRKWPLTWLSAVVQRCMHGTWPTTKTKSKWRKLNRHKLLRRRRSATMWMSYSWGLLKLRDLLRKLRTSQVWKRCRGLWAKSTRLTRLCPGKVVASEVIKSISLYKVCLNLCLFFHVNFLRQKPSCWNL